jgi:hypothetical protein
MENENSRNLFGRKEAEGFVRYVANSASSGMPPGLPTTGAKVPSPVFERSMRGAGKDLTRDHSADELRWGANLQPAGRR